MENLQEYKCPCCGGAVVFDSSLQKMKCPYCDTEFEIDALKEYSQEVQSQQADEMNWEMPTGSQRKDGEEEGLRSYICKSCGGEIVGDENMAAAACPFCGNSVIITQQFAGALRPDCVIPFKLDKKAAKEALNRHYKNKPFLPKVFKNQNHIDEVKGIYVPFWLFDAQAEAKLRYRATRVRSWNDSNYHYTQTSYYAVMRAGTICFERVPVDGSSKMPDDLMESIEPFDFSEAVDFQTAYLAGYLADKYDVDAQQSIERANERVKQSTQDNFQKTVQGYVTVLPESTNVQLHNGKAHYALYPVWILNTTWKGTNYTFAMNGQTGKLVGDLPVDNGAFAGWLFGLWGIISAAAFGISYLLWLL